MSVRRSAGLRAWFVRMGFVAVSFVSLWLSQIADQRFRETVATAARFDLRLWSATITPLILAGAFFTIAARFPFPRPRFAWGRLVLAVAAAIPAVHMGFVLWAPQFAVRWPTFLIIPRWFDGGSVPAVCAVLVGVAIGSGFGARREPARSS